jgi:hypothetical protein
MENHMQTKTTDTPIAMAHVLAMIMATHAEIDPREVRLLEDLDAFKRIGMSEAEFLRVADDYRNGACKALSGHDWLHLDDLEVIDEILDGVSDTKHRLLLCRLAGCIITADGRVREVEGAIYDRMLLHWGYTRSSVVQAILAARVR